MQIVVPVKDIKNKTLAIILLSAVVVAGVFYYLVDPEETVCLVCPFEFLTGLKCPGCGSQRALHHLLHFEFLEALRDNAFLVVMIPVLALMAFAELFGSKSGRLGKLFGSKAFPVILLVLLTIWFIGRNCRLFQAFFISL